MSYILWQRRLHLYHELPKLFYCASCSLVSTLDPVMVSLSAHMSSSRRIKARALGGIPGPPHRGHLSGAEQKATTWYVMRICSTSCVPYPVHVPSLCPKFPAFANFSRHAILQFISRSRSLGRQAPRHATEFGEWNTGRTRRTRVCF